MTGGGIAVPGLGMAPLVSVIIPAFNAARFLAEAIDSVLAQDYPALDIIVVDDGSTDATRAIIDGYGERVRAISQPNGGCGAARNAGLRAARGQYVAFLDADDVWWPHKIRHQIDALKESGYRMAYSRFICWTPAADGAYASRAQMFGNVDHPDLSDCALVTGNTYSHLLLDCIVWTSTVLVEKTLLDAVGPFDESLAMGEDYDLWLRLSQATDMLGIEQPTALYRQHSQSITRSVREVNYEYLVIDRALARWGEGSHEQPVGASNPDRARLSAIMRQRLARSMSGHGYNHARHGSQQVAADAYLKVLQHGGLRLKPMVLYALCKFRSLISENT